ncbi:MAG: tripartite tricarboxylate transporter substrate binding protein [Rhodospirillales bacterium]|nr:tripartite tricarboxylate transporter substrate binding protein [Rhodospirillales bacterium]
MTKSRTARTMAAVLLAVGAALGTTSALAAWPERPVTLIVPWSAGGGTDATGRIVAKLLEDQIGQPVNVVNRTGGGGVVGHTAIAQAKPDGYTLGVITTELSMFHWIGTSPLAYGDYTLIGLYNLDPEAVHVRKDSDWKSLEDLVAAVRADPGKHKASGANQGGAAHLSLAGMMNALGLKNAAPWVPTEGAAPSMQLLVSDAIDIVCTTMPEAQSMKDAGEVTTLAVMADERSAAFPDVPTVKEAIGIDWTVGAWRGIGAPKGLPQEVVDVVVPALEKVVASAEFKDFMKKRNFGMAWSGPDKFQQFLATADKNFGDAMKAVGLAK